MHLNIEGDIWDTTCMRYYFHLRIAGTLSPDEIGLELPDVETAYLQAFETAQAMWAELLAQRRDPLTRAFEITDEDGQVLLTLPFAEVLERARKPGRRLPRLVGVLKAAVQERDRLLGSLREQIKAARKTAEDTRKMLKEVGEGESSKHAPEKSSSLDAGERLADASRGFRAEARAVPAYAVGRTQEPERARTPLDDDHEERLARLGAMCREMIETNQELIEISQSLNRLSRRVNNPTAPIGFWGGAGMDNRYSRSERRQTQTPDLIAKSHKAIERSRERLRALA